MNKYESICIESVDDLITWDRISHLRNWEESKMIYIWQCDDWDHAFEVLDSGDLPNALYWISIDDELPDWIEEFDDYECEAGDSDEAEYTFFISDECYNDPLYYTDKFKDIDAISIWDKVEMEYEFNSFDELEEVKVSAISDWIYTLRNQHWDTEDVERIYFRLLEPDAPVKSVDNKTKLTIHNIYDWCSVTIEHNWKEYDYHFIWKDRDDDYIFQCNKWIDSSNVEWAILNYADKYVEDASNASWIEVSSDYKYTHVKKYEIEQQDNWYKYYLNDDQSDKLLATIVAKETVRLKVWDKVKLLDTNWSSKYIKWLVYYIVDDDDDGMPYRLSLTKWWERVTEHYFYASSMEATDEAEQVTITLSPIVNLIDRSDWQECTEWYHVIDNIYEVKGWDWGKYRANWTDVIPEDYKHRLSNYYVRCWTEQAKVFQDWLFKEWDIITWLLNDYTYTTTDAIMKVESTTSTRMFVRILEHKTTESKEWSWYEVSNNNSDFELYTWTLRTKETISQPKVEVINKPINTMSTFDKLQTEEFFSNKKNVKGIKDMKETLQGSEETFGRARRDLSTMEDKAWQLKREFNDALSRDDYASIEKILKENVELIEYLNVYSTNTVKQIGEDKTEARTSIRFFNR